jgi:peptide/nickel transport system substrate-binding protein
LRPQPDWPTNVQAGNQSQFIYETSVRFNLLDGSLSPGLAKELQQPETTRSSCPLQMAPSGPTGSDLTADDVVFTFELGKTAPVTFATAAGNTSIRSRPPIRGPSSSR